MKFEEFLFWGIMVAWFLVGAFGYWRGRKDGKLDAFGLGGNVCIFILFLILGWGRFGDPIN